MIYQRRLPGPPCRLAALHERGISNLTESEFVHKFGVPKLAIRHRATSNFSREYFLSHALLGAREITTRVLQITTLCLADLFLLQTPPPPTPSPTGTRSDATTLSVLQNPKETPPSHHPLPALPGEFISLGIKNHQQKRKKGEKT